MENFQKKAWNCLTDKERTALQLTLSLDKTPMESAIIMNIYPYKFSEVLSRAKKFFFMFSNHFELYGDLFDGSTILTSEVKAFLEDLVKNRYTIKRAMLNPLCVSFFDVYYRKRALEKALEYLLKEKDYIYEFLLEFDRWNSFRVLPKSVQKPSPFKRRQNKAFKKISEQMVGLTEMSYSIIVQTFKKDLPPYIYTPILSEYEQNKYKVLSITDSKSNRAWLGKNKLPAFVLESDAKKFALFMMEYHYSRTKNSYLARKYWPGFKAFINKACNVYDLLEIKDFKTLVEEMTLKKQIQDLTKYQ